MAEDDQTRHLGESQEDFEPADVAPVASLEKLAKVAGWDVKRLTLGLLADKQGHI
jgi:hypothetical protein